MSLCRRLSTCESRSLEWSLRSSYQHNIISASEFFSPGHGVVFVIFAGADGLASGRSSVVEWQILLMSEAET